MPSETSSIGRSLGMLCITLCFIYVVFFGVHGDAIKEEVAYLTQAQYTSADVAGLAVHAIDANIDVHQPTVTVVSPTTTTVQAPEMVPGRRFYSAQELFRPDETSEVEVQYSKILFPDTREREGTLKSLVAVGLQGRQEYILKNIDNTHFIYYGDFAGDEEYLRRAVADKGGNIVAITDKNTIDEQQLFGDEVWMIYLPDFQDIKVLMLVFFNSGKDVRYLQVDKDTYPKRKQELKDTFAARYDW